MITKRERGGSDALAPGVNTPGLQALAWKSSIQRVVLFMPATRSSPRPSGARSSGDGDTVAAARDGHLDSPYTIRDPVPLSEIPVTPGVFTRGYLSPLPSPMTYDDEDGLTEPTSPRLTPAADPGPMFFSAAIFGAFGFLMLSGSQSTLMFTVIVWSLRGGAIGFLIAGIMATMRLPFATMFYILVSLVTSVLFIVGGVWHMIVLGPMVINGILLVVFGVWNGMGSLGALKARSIRQRAV